MSEPDSFEFDDATERIAEVLRTSQTGGEVIAAIYNGLVPVGEPRMVYDGDSQFHMETC